MKAILDTSSLMSMVRYYFPFDTENTLTQFIKAKLTSGEWIIIDKVHEEAKYLSGGLILNKMSFLKDKNFIKSANIAYRTELIIPPAPRRFANMLNDNFTIPVMKRRLSPAEFEVNKDNFVRSADMRQVLLCWSLAHNNEEAIVVTEETGASNDNKLFKKIPAICEQLGLLSATLPQLMGRYTGEVVIRFEAVGRKKSNT